MIPVSNNYSVLTKWIAEIWECDDIAEKTWKKKNLFRRKKQKWTGKITTQPGGCKQPN